MFYLLQSIFSLILNLGYEVILYIFIDVLVKTFLREARDDREKRVIWLCEAGVLLLLCLLLWLFHHTPYLLPLLTVATFVYTQLVGRVNFRYWWYQLRTRWDDFEQLQESMEQYAEMQSLQFHNPQHPPPNVHVSQVSLAPASLPTHTQHWLPQQSQPSMPHPGSGQQQPVVTSESGACEAWYPGGSEPAAASTPVSGALPPGAGLRQRISPIVPNHHPGASPQTTPHRFYSPASTPPPAAARRPDLAAAVPRRDLARRPLHPSPSIRPSPRTAAGFSAALKTRVWWALGLPSPSPPSPPGGAAGAPPPGLPNPGAGAANLCFMNAVLQCLAASPGLVEALGAEVAAGTPAPGNQGELVSAVTALLQTLRHGGCSAADTSAVRSAASRCGAAASSLVAPAPGQQQQQDAAEFLMWALDALHSALNRRQKLRSAAAGNGDRSPPLLPSMTLSMLKFIYGDLSPARVDELKDACRKEIASACGGDAASYAEPIQRLADLEWLAHKEQHASCVDQLFTGQMVEARHCLACAHLSVGLQTFSVLPVALTPSPPRRPSGLLHLADCFARFGTIEDLLGADGLRCDRCNAAPLVTRKRQRGNAASGEQQTHGASPHLTNGGAATGLRHRVAAGGSPGVTTATPMSPIAGETGAFNDSGFHDNNNIRTSTPIGGAVRSPPPPAAPPVRVTDGQRRCLLRQLPDCLVVQLMRFSVNHGVAHKVLRPVSVPLTNLDLTHLVIDNVLQRDDLTATSAGSHAPQPLRYALYGLVVHLGGPATSHGHYVAYVKAADANWYRCDDTQVRPVNMEYELNTREVRENAYLLFYRRST